MRLFSFFISLRSWLETHANLRRGLMAIALCGLSAALLFPSLGYPRDLVFDEAISIPVAQKYLNHVFHLENHPPLARLLMALGQKLLHPGEPSAQIIDRPEVKTPWPKETDIAGYRLFSAIFGTLLPLFTFLIFLRITENDWLALFIGLATTLDNALKTQTHFALLENSQLFFSFVAIFCFIWLQTQEKPGNWQSCLAWLFFGASLAAAFLVKLTGLFVMVAVPFAIYRLFTNGQLRKIGAYLLIFGLGFLVVFLLVWQIHFSLLTQFDRQATFEISESHRAILEGNANFNPIEHFWIRLSDTYRYMLFFHGHVPELNLNKPGEIGSAWYQWPIGGRVIPFYAVQSETNLKAIYLIGNPAVWLISLLGVIGGFTMLLARLAFRNFRPRYFQWYLFFGALYLAYMLPMTQINRVMYLYHYLSPMLIGLILSGLIFLELPNLSPRAKAEIIILASLWIATAFWLYSPFTYFLPISYDYFDALNFWPPWDLRLP